ncbi:hypothetical protein B0T12DRAFT_428277 [Alternaria alternata]|nr:hypothetical protein B0T12DRAFT_428277 [Alternaria alternata]
MSKSVKSNHCSTITYHSSNSFLASFKDKVRNSHHIIPTTPPARASRRTPALNSSSRRMRGRLRAT